jgi:plasmid maintenance system killer protein
MISSIRDKGLKRLYDTGDPRDLKQDQVKRIRRILGILDTAARIEDVDQLPGLRPSSQRKPSGLLVGVGFRQLADRVPV